MNKRYAMIKDGRVVNITIWDGLSEWHPGSEYTLIELSDGQFVDMGYKYSGQVFIAPESPPSNRR